MEQDCLIHYPAIKFSRHLTPITRERYEKLSEAKEARIKLGGPHLRMM